MNKITVPALIALSLVFGACGEQTIETPDAVNDDIEQGVENVEQGADDAGNAIEEGAQDTGDAVDGGLKDLEKGAEDAADAAQDGLKQGLEKTGNAVENLGEEIPSSEEQ